MINSQVHIFKILSSYSKFLFFQVKYVFSSCKRFTHHCQRAQRRTRKGPSTQKNLSKITFLMKYYKLSCSAHQTPNFKNPEFQFPQFQVLPSVFFFFQYNKLYWHFWVHFDINLKLLSGKNTGKVNKQIFEIRKIGCSMS